MTVATERFIAVHTRTLTTILATLVLATASFAQSRPKSDAPPTLAVTGEGSVEIEPDRAIVRLGVVEEAKTAKEAMHNVNKKLTEARDAIEDLEIEGAQLTTSELSIQPVYESRDNRRSWDSREIVGYRASNTLSVRVDDIDRVGEAIDASVKAGVNQMHGLTFTSRDPFEAETMALAEATKRARKKANVMAGAMGGTIAGVIEAEEGGGSSGPPSPRMRSRTMAMESSAMAPTPVEAGSLTITARVHILYELSFD